MDRNWKLGDDLHEQDNVLDAMTFDEIIITIQCNEKIINKDSAKKVAKEIFNMKRIDFEELLEINLDEIVKRAKARRN